MNPSRSLTLGVVLCAVLVAVWAIGRSTSVQSERDTIAAQAQANAQVAHKASRETRKLVKPALARTDTVTRRVMVQDAALGSQLDTARAVLADTAATLAVVRETLAATVVQAETFRVAVDSLTVVHAAERRVLLAALTSADVALDAQVRATEAFKRAGECRIVFGIKCPTRSQSFIVGAVATVAVFVAVR